MHRTITISLPVADLADSTAFYTALGFKQDLRFSDPEAAFMGWSEVIHITLLTHTRWHTLTDRPILPSMSREVGLQHLGRVAYKRPCHKRCGRLAL